MNPNALRGHLERERVRRRTVLCELGRAIQHDVRSDAARLAHPPRDQRIELRVGCLVRHDDEKVPVAVRVRVASRPATEQPDLEWVPPVEDVREQRAERLEIERATGSIGPGAVGFASALREPSMRGLCHTVSLARRRRPAKAAYFTTTVFTRRAPPRS